MNSDITILGVWAGMDILHCSWREKETLIQKGKEDS
jgi:hypothetical protein